MQRQTLNALRGDGSSWVQDRGIAYLNVVVACFCVLLMTAALGQFASRLFRARGSRWWGNALPRAPSDGHSC